MPHFDFRTEFLYFAQYIWKLSQELSLFHKLQCASLEFTFADHILGVYRVTLCIELFSSLGLGALDCFVSFCNDTGHSVVFVCSPSNCVG